MNLRIRLADPTTDAVGVAEIYDAAVLGSTATFEVDPPGPDEMARRMREVLRRTPWLVAEEGGQVVGYCYAGPHHGRPGYRWSVNISAYVRDGFRGRGIGTALYGALLALLRRQGFVNAYAGIALPNEPSVALHEGLGMEPVGVYRRVGWKAGAWHDVAWYALRLGEPEIGPDGVPREPTPIGMLDR
jgi:L-amino acid N-acyltransferase YncA